MAINPLLDPVFIAGHLPLLLPQVAWVTPISVCTPKVIDEATFQINENFRFMEPPIKFELRDLLTTRLFSFSNLENNWDGYGAEIPDENTIKNSCALLSMLPDDIIQTLDPEDIVISPYGTVVLDWRKNDQLLSIEIGTEKIGFFTEFENSKYVSLDNTTFSAIKLPDEMVDAFRELFS